MKKSNNKIKSAIYESDGSTKGTFGRMLGVDHKTITRDLAGENSPKQSLPPIQIKNNSGENSPTPLSITQSGADEYQLNKNSNDLKP